MSAFSRSRDSAEMSHSTLTTPQDAHRMAYAAYCDGYDDAWHGAYARAHGEPLSREIYAALRAGRAAARADETKEIAGC